MPDTEMDAARGALREGVTEAQRKGRRDRDLSELAAVWLNIDPLSIRWSERETVHPILQKNLREVLERAWEAGRASAAPSEAGGGEIPKDYLEAAGFIAYRDGTWAIKGPHEPAPLAAQGYTFVPIALDAYQVLAALDLSSPSQGSDTGEAGREPGSYVDYDELHRLFGQIPSGPWQDMCSTGGHEIRQIDTDPTDKHHWPFRLCQSIAGQRAACDDAVFAFLAGVLNAWPEIYAQFSDDAYIARVLDMPEDELRKRFIADGECPDQAAQIAKLSFQVASLRATLIRIGSQYVENRGDMTAEEALTAIGRLATEAARSPAQPSTAPQGADLAGLSAAATQGELSAPDWGTDFRAGKVPIGMTSPAGDGNGKADRAFIVALWNAYRCGALVPTTSAPPASAVDRKAVDAVAEAWASIDGEDDHYRRERDEGIGLTDPACTGRYEGYLAEAEELIARIRRRGFDVLAHPGSVAPISGERGGWLPIETADPPLDDVTVDLPDDARDGLGWAVCDVSGEFAYHTWWTYEGGGVSKVTHWHPPIAGPTPASPPTATQDPDHG